jgi:hypothetical protein
MSRHLRIGIPLGLALVACAQLAVAQTSKPAPSAAQAPKSAPVPPAVKPSAPAAQSANGLAETRDRNLRAYVELLRSDLRSQVVAIITEVMQFSEAEDAKFWPVYRELEAELQKINDERLAGIEEYSKTYDRLTDATADRLAKMSLDLEARRNATKAKYYEKLKTVISPKTAARFLQVENQILLLLDLQIASSLPIAE